MDRLLGFLAALADGEIPKARANEKELLDAFGVSTANQLPEGGKFDVEKVFRSPARFTREKIGKAAARIKRNLEMRKRSMLLAIIALYEPDVSIPETELLVSVEKIAADMRADFEQRVRVLYDDVNDLKRKLGEEPVPPRMIARMSDAELIAFHDELVVLHEIADHFYSHPEAATAAA